MYVGEKEEEGEGEAEADWGVLEDITEEVEEDRDE
jgi:hypothetical protein